jgi:hypothetical protein
MRSERHVKAAKSFAASRGPFCRIEKNRCDKLSLGASIGIPMPNAVRYDLAGRIQVVSTAETMRLIDRVWL